LPFYPLEPEARLARPLVELDRDGPHQMTVFAPIRPFNLSP
jgi:hypothetical protein